MLDEVHRLREENAEAKHQLKHQQRGQPTAGGERQFEVQDKQQEPGVQQEQPAGPPRQHAAASMAAAEVELLELQRAQARKLAELEAELALAQQQNAELQQQLQQAQSADAAGPAGTARGSTTSAPPSPTAIAAREVAAAGPGVSAFISQLVLQEVAAAGHSEGPPAPKGMPTELAALLPASLFALPEWGAGGEATLQLTSDIYVLLDALEQEKQQLVAAVNAKQVRWVHGTRVTTGFTLLLPTCLLPAATACRRRWSSSCGAD